MINTYPLLTASTNYRDSDKWEFLFIVGEINKHIEEGSKLGEDEATVFNIPNYLKDELVDLYKKAGYNVERSAVSLTFSGWAPKEV